MHYSYINLIKSRDFPRCSFNILTSAKLIIKYWGTWKNDNILLILNTRYIKKIRNLTKFLTEGHNDVIKNITSFRSIKYLLY